MCGCERATERQRQRQRDREKGWGWQGGIEENSTPQNSGLQLSFPTRMVAGASGSHPNKVLTARNKTVSTKQGLSTQYPAHTKHAHTCDHRAISLSIYSSRSP